MTEGASSMRDNNEEDSGARAADNVTANPSAQEPLSKETPPTVEEDVMASQTTSVNEKPPVAGAASDESVTMEGANEHTDTGVNTESPPPKAAHDAADLPFTSEETRGLEGMQRSHSTSTLDSQAGDDLYETMSDFDTTPLPFQGAHFDMDSKASANGSLAMSSNTSPPSTKKDAKTLVIPSTQERRFSQFVDGILPFGYVFPQTSVPPVDQKDRLNRMEVAQSSQNVIDWLGTSPDDQMNPWASVESDTSSAGNYSQFAVQPDLSDLRLHSVHVSEPHVIQHEARQRNAPPSILNEEQFKRNSFAAIYDCTSPGIFDQFATTAFTDPADGLEREELGEPFLNGDHSQASFASPISIQNRNPYFHEFTSSLPDNDGNHTQEPRAATSSPKASPPRSPLQESSASILKDSSIVSSPHVPPRDDALPKRDAAELNPSQPAESEANRDTSLHPDPKRISTENTEDSQSTPQGASSHDSALGALKVASVGSHDEATAPQESPTSLKPETHSSSEHGEPSPSHEPSHEPSPSHADAEETNIETKSDDVPVGDEEQDPESLSEVTTDTENKGVKPDSEAPTENKPDSEAPTGAEEKIREPHSVPTPSASMEHTDISPEGPAHLSADAAQLASPTSDASRYTSESRVEAYRPTSALRSSHSFQFFNEPQSSTFAGADGLETADAREHGAFEQAISGLPQDIDIARDEYRRSGSLFEMSLQDPGPHAKNHDKDITLVVGKRTLEAPAEIEGDNTKGPYELLSPRHHMARSYHVAKPSPKRVVHARSSSGLVTSIVTAMGGGKGTPQSAARASPDSRSLSSAGLSSATRTSRVISQLQDEVFHLHGQLAAAREQIHQSHKESVASERRVHDLRAASTSWEGEKERLLHALSTKDKIIAEQEAQNAALQTQVESAKYLEVEHEKLQVELLRSKTESDIFSDSVTRIKSSFAQELRNIHSELGAYQAQYDKKVAALAQETAQLKGIVESVMLLHKESSTMSEGLAKLRAQAEEIQHSDALVASQVKAIDNLGKLVNY